MAETGTLDFEELDLRFNTVCAFWHDAYAKWQVKADGQRRTFDDCRHEGWGYTLAEAVAALIEEVDGA